jgi:2Fe-2S ferredoxin
LPGSPVPIVRVEPLGVEIEVAPGEPLADAAWRVGYVWPTRCWGQAECMVCRVRILEGEDRTEPADAEERTALRRHAGIDVDRERVRLGCRLHVVGEGVVVEKAGVKPPGS